MYAAKTNGLTEVKCDRGEVMVQMTVEIMGLQMP